MLRLLHFLTHDLKPMKRPNNTKARIVLDIAIQVLFYATLIAGFWLLSFLIP